MNKQIAFVIDPLTSLNVKKDSTIAMMQSAQQLGCQVWALQVEDLSIVEGEAFGLMQRLDVDLNASPWYQAEQAISMPLAEMDVIFMRKDPPFDMRFIYATYMLELAERRGVQVINRPQALRDANEKLFATWFPQCMTPTLVSSQFAAIVAFQAQHEDIIIKPLDGMGGAAIFRVKPGDGNLDVIVELLTDQGRQPVMIQRFIPDVSAGDKRILLIDGEPIHDALARIPQRGAVRANLAAGGTAKAVKLTERDVWLCQQIAPTLREKGLRFVGLDVIGDYITEINVTSPTCLRQIYDQTGTDIAKLLLEAVISKSSSHSF